MEEVLVDRRRDDLKRMSETLLAAAGEHDDNTGLACNPALFYGHPHCGICNDAEAMLAAYRKAQ